MSLKIAILEDESDVLEILCSIFPKEHFSTVGFTEAEPALNYILENEVDLVCHGLIIPMPKTWNNRICKFGARTGIEFARRIREKRPSLPLLALTNNNDSDVHQEMKAAGVDIILTKPAFAYNIIKAAKQLLTI